MSAHVSFVGGGLVLPSRTPYERELLHEHVLNCARGHEHVRVTVDRRTWRIERLGSTRLVACARCGRPLDIAARPTSRDNELYCVACVLSLSRATAPHRRDGSR